MLGPVLAAAFMLFCWIAGKTDLNANKNKAPKHTSEYKVRTEESLPQ